MKIVDKKWLYLSVLSVVWGSSFILIKKGLIGLSALQVGSLRIIFAAIFLLLIGFKSLSKIPKEMSQAPSSVPQRGNGDPFMQATMLAELAGQDWSAHACKKT